MIMAETSRQLVHKLEPDGIKIHREGNLNTKNSLQISFQRTVRVSDNDTTNGLPPSLGNFPVFETSAYDSLPKAMEAKGGYFIHMHRMYTYHTIRETN